MDSIFRGLNYYEDLNESQHGIVENAARAVIDAGNATTAGDEAAYRLANRRYEHYRRRLLKQSEALPCLGGLFMDIEQYRREF